MGASAAGSTIVVGQEMSCSLSGKFGSAFRRLSPIDYAHRQRTTPCTLCVSAASTAMLGFPTEDIKTGGSF